MNRYAKIVVLAVLAVLMTRPAAAQPLYPQPVELKDFFEVVQSWSIGCTGRYVYSTWGDFSEIVYLGVAGEECVFYAPEASLEFNLEASDYFTIQDVTYTKGDFVIRTDWLGFDGTSQGDVRNPAWATFFFSPRYFPAEIGDFPN